MKVYVDWDFEGAFTTEAEAFVESLYSGDGCDVHTHLKKEDYEKLCELMGVDCIVDVPDEIAEDEIEDYLSETYNFCHFGFEPVEETKNMNDPNANAKTAWLAHRALVKTHQEMFFRKAVDPSDEHLVPQFMFMLETITQLGLEICNYDAPPYGYDLDYLSEHPTHTSWVYRRTFQYLPKINALQNSPEPLKQRFLIANQILTLISENFNESF